MRKLRSILLLAPLLVACGGGDGATSSEAPGASSSSSGGPGGGSTSTGGHDAMGGGGAGGDGGGGGGGGSGGGAAQLISVAATACAQRGDGAVWCWGSNATGQLGDGAQDDDDHPAPTRVADLHDLLQIEVASGFTCARSKQDVLCWGKNDAGELGLGTTDAALVPTKVPDAAGAVWLAANETQACVAMPDGKVRCWGAGTLSPTEVVGVEGAVGVSVSDGYACAWRADGTATCWGHNLSNRLGHTGNDAAPTDVVGAVDVARVSTGTNSTCALQRSGKVLCWGGNGGGELGDGDVDDMPVLPPASVVDVTTARALDVGVRHACVALETGEVRCWGRADMGELGDGSSTQSVTPYPEPVVGPTSVTTISVYYGVGCSIGGGEVQCWGDDAKGVLGHAPGAGPSLPTPVVFPK